MSVTVYGIASCDTCRKARRWLAVQGIEHRWVDLRAEGVEPERLESWLEAIGPDTLVNRRSATWRALPEDKRPALDAPDLAGYLRAHPTLIKRPVFEAAGSALRAGFDEVTRDWIVKAAG